MLFARTGHVGPQGLPEALPPPSPRGGLAPLLGAASPQPSLKSAPVLQPPAPHIVTHAHSQQMNHPGVSNPNSPWGSQGWRGERWGKGGRSAGSSGVSPLPGAPHLFFVPGTDPVPRPPSWPCTFLPVLPSGPIFPHTHGTLGGGCLYDSVMPWGDPWKCRSENVMQKAKVAFAAPAQGEGCPVGARRDPDPGPRASRGEKAT